jgi:serine/threonine protein kinase
MNQNSNSLGIFTESITQVGCPNCSSELDVSEFEVFEEISCPSCGEKFQVPGRLGDFILIEELGRGAMGCVYLAMDESLNRLVALKVLRKEYGEDPKMLETVQREAQAMATLNHRNIVQVYSFGRVKEQPYFVMELLQGERLDEMMADGGIIAEIRALEIALDVANGLDAANQAGLTHGDIKPANILMNDHGVAKVVDFGLAKFMEPGAEIEVWGTPYYIAPEKARKKGEDSRSDQYSLGGTIFHSLAGKPPFDGPNPTKVVVAALKEDTPVLKDHNPDVTDKTSAVLLRMMDKNPNRRYPTYASLLADLTLALTGARAAEEERLLEEKLLKEKQNKKLNPLIWIVMLVMLVVTGGIGMVVWQQVRSSTVQQIVYPGPQRELHEPFSRAEIRNIQQAVSALSDNNFTEALERLSVVQNLIPENHSALSWFHFMEAGMYFYAQHPEEARESLRKAADMENPIFDASRTPSEDPRILAQYALGRIDDRELEKASRRTEPYFLHLAEVAKGYRFLLQDQANQSARHFRYYTEVRVTGSEWAYLLRPIAPFLHLPLEKLMTEEEIKAALEERGRDLLSGLGSTPAPTPTPEPTPRPVEQSAAVSQTSESPVRKGLIVNLNFTEPQAATPLNDLPGRDPVVFGEFKGGLEWVRDEQKGGAMQYDGRSARMEAETQSPFSRQEISFAFRLYPEPWNGGARNIITQKLKDDHSANRSLFSIYTSAQGELTVKIGGITVDTGVTLPLSWSDVVITFNGKLSQDQLNVFLDGKLVWKGNINGITGIPSPREVLTYAPDEVEPGRWKGKFASIQIYERALIPSEISLLFLNL